MRLLLKRGLIRPWELSDVPCLQRYADNRNISRNLRDAFPHPYTLDSAHAFLAFIAQEKPAMNFAIATETEAIGGIGLKRGTDVHRLTAELGYWLGEPFWGRGIMTEAVTAFSDWAFEELGLQRIHAQPFAINDASARVLEKAGFQLEGRMRADVIKGGKVLDSLLYARVRS